MTARKILPALFWILAFILAGFILVKLPLSTIVQEIKNLSLTQWILWISVNWSIVFFATYRWLILTNSLNLPVKFITLLMIRQAGQTVSFITPGAQFGGEPLQVFWLCKRKIAIHNALLAVGLDRFFELWVNFGVLLLSFLLLIFSNAINVNLQKMLLFLLFMLFAMSLFGWLILNQPTKILDWLKRVTHHWQHHPRLQRIKTHWQQLNNDLKFVIANQKIMLSRAFIVSLLSWCGLIGELWLLLTFFNLHFDFANFLVIFVAMRLAFLLPLPGGIGTLEAAIFWSFHHLNFPESAALGVIALMRLRDAVVLLGGFVCLKLLHWREVI